MSEKTSPNLKITPAKNGQPTASICRSDGRELFLHSRIDPGAEARFLIADIPIKEETLYVILGCGLGYHIKELLKKIPQSSRIVVVESSQNLLRNEMAAVCRRLGEKWFTDKRLSFAAVATPEAASFSLVKLYIDARLFSLEMFTHIPSASTDIAFYRQTAGSIQQDFPNLLSSHLQTIDAELENNLTNYWANLNCTLTDPSVEALAAKWQNKPALIVSAGPSLTGQLAELKKAKGKAVIICVGTAAPILLNQGIAPDFIIAVDPFPANMANFKGWDTNQTALIYYQRIWREIPPAFKGLKFWFAMNGEISNPVRRHISNMPFSKGGTVAFSALEFAKYIEAAPIIFVGQDFAFHAGKTHAAGSIYDNGKIGYDEQALANGFFHVPGVNGQPVVTNHSYYAFLVFMQEYLLAHQDTLYINTSPTGAKIGGTEEMTLENALDTFCRQEIAIGEIIQRNNIYIPSTHQNSIAAFTVWEQDIAQFLNAIPEQNLNKLYSKFKKLSIYKINAPYYDDFFYVRKLQERWRPSQKENNILNRIKLHLIAIQKAVKNGCETEF